MNYTDLKERNVIEREPLMALTVAFASIQAKSKYKVAEKTQNLIEKK